MKQKFVNTQPRPIYVSVEPWPDCFELEPGETLTLVWEATSSRDALQIDILNDRELVLYPDGEIDDIRYLIDGEDAEGRSWSFKHR
jgi:hypothetical protein